MNKNTENWKNILDPVILKGNLISISLYIALFESLKDSIIEKVKSFFTFGFNENGMIIDSKYKEKVLSKNKSPFYASFEWLKEINLVSQEDIELFGELKKYRNKLTHEMLNFLFDSEFEEYPDFFLKLIKLRTKIEKNWIMNVEIPTNSDFDKKEIDYDDIQPFSLIFTKMLFDIAFGEEDEANKYYTEFTKIKNNKNV